MGAEGRGTVTVRGGFRKSEKMSDLPSPSQPGGGPKVRVSFTVVEETQVRELVRCFSVKGWKQHASAWNATGDCFSERTSM